MTPKTSFHLARVISNALSLGENSVLPMDSLTNFAPDEVGTVQETGAGNARFRVTYIDPNIEGPDKRRSYSVLVREAT